MHQGQTKQAVGQMPEIARQVALDLAALSESVCDVEMFRSNKELISIP